MTWGLIAIGVLGLLLVALGLRGRRLDDHPCCRRCGYDLIAPPTLPPACPECGASLGGRLAIRVGRRRRRTWTLGLGALLVVGALVAGGLALRGTDWTPYKPVWLLRQEAFGLDATRAQNARSEILRRLNDDRLSARQVRSLVDTALRIQADPVAAWSTDWGDLVEGAWERRLVDRATFGRYGRTAAEPALTLQLRSRVREGADMAYMFRSGPARVGSTTELVLLRGRTSFAVSGGRLLHGRDETALTVLSRASPTGTGASFPLDLPPGRHRIVAEAAWAVAPRGRLPSGSPRRGADADTRADPYGRALEDAVVSWIQRLEGEVEVVGAGETVVARAAAPEFASHVRARVEIRVCEVREIPGRAPAALCQVTSSSLPVDAAFDILWRVGDREWLVGGVVTWAPSRRLGPADVGPGAGTLDGFPADAEAIDLVLRTNPSLAEPMLDILEVWDGELVFEQVPLTRPGP